LGLLDPERLGEHARTFLRGEEPDAQLGGEAENRLHPVAEADDFLGALLGRLAEADQPLARVLDADAEPAEAAVCLTRGQIGLQNLLTDGPDHPRSIDNG